MNDAHQKECAKLCNSGEGSDISLAGYTLRTNEPVGRSLCLFQIGTVGCMAHNLGVFLHVVKPNSEV